MNFNDVTNLFTQKGFTLIKSNIPNVQIFLKSSAQETLEICLFVKNTSQLFLTVDALNSFSEALERKFLFNGFHKVNIFYMILSDHIERDKSMLEQPRPFWLIDELAQRLIIFEKQPDNYFDLKEGFEKLLSVSTDKASPKQLPLMTISLITINVFIFLFMSFASGTDNSGYLLKHGASYWKYIFEDKEYYRLFTCMFLHFDGEHILNNMITLAVVGSTTEAILGHFHFLCIYLLSGVGSSFLSALYYMHNASDSVTISAGASGAIFGILGAFIIIALLFKREYKNFNPTTIIFVILFSVLNGFLSTSVDNAAHIGGLFFGIIFTFISCLCRKNILK